MVFVVVRNTLLNKQLICRWFCDDFRLIQCQENQRETRINPGTKTLGSYQIILFGIICDWQYNLRIILIPMAMCKPAINLLLTHWNYCSLAISHRYIVDAFFVFQCGLVLPDSTHTSQWGHNERDGVSNHQRLDFCSIVCSGADQKEHQSAASLAYVWGIQWWPVDSPHKRPVMQWRQCQGGHDDVIKWKHFPRYWPFVRGIHRSLVNSPHKGQWDRALMFSLIYAWTNGQQSKRRWFETPLCS